MTCSGTRWQLPGGQLGSARRRGTEPFGWCQFFSFFPSVTLLTRKRTCRDLQQIPADTALAATTTTPCGTPTSRRWGCLARWTSARLGREAPQMVTGDRTADLGCPGWTGCTRRSAPSPSTTARLSGKGLRSGVEKRQPFQLSVLGFGACVSASCAPARPPVLRFKRTHD